MFSFRGDVLPSKSWLNRALVMQHFNPYLNFRSDSRSEDVLVLKEALKNINTTQSFDLGLGGTSLRFFTFAVSRRPGHWVIHAGERLMQRPQQELINVLAQLGVIAEFTPLGLQLHSKGWKSDSLVKVQADLSSQFISGLLLSCWNLEFDLEIEIKKPITSFGYLKMTIELLLLSGMNLQIIETDHSYFCRVPKQQKADVNSLTAEMDVSSAFSLAAAAVVAGQVEITNWNEISSQPDLEFLQIFKKMEILFEIRNGSFFISRQNSWQPVEWNLNNSPDLFPVLAVLCGFADGVSTLYGAAQLKSKESDRIAKTHELLQLAGIRSELLSDGLKIFGSSASSNVAAFSFDPDSDHRMAMAAALLKLKSFPVEILSPEVVNKSYPDFWKDIGL